MHELVSDQKLRFFYLAPSIELIGLWLFSISAEYVLLFLFFGFLDLVFTFTLSDLFCVITEIDPSLAMSPENLLTDFESKPDYGLTSWNLKFDAFGLWLALGLKLTELPKFID